MPLEGTRDFNDVEGHKQKKDKNEVASEIEKFKQRIA